MDVTTNTIIALFEIALILFQVIILSKQYVAIEKLKKDNEQWKSNIESLYSNEIKDIIEQNKQVLNAFNSFIKTKML